MQFNIPIDKLQKRGYICQKLYAANYITYYRKIGSYGIRLWVRGRTIEINDWYDYTDIIVPFYLSLPEEQRQRKGVALELDRKERVVRVRDLPRMIKEQLQPDDPYFDKWETIFIHNESFQKV